MHLEKKMDPYLYCILLESYYLSNQIEKAEKVLVVCKKFLRHHHIVFYYTINLQLAVAKKEGNRMDYFYKKLMNFEANDDEEMHEVEIIEFYCHIIMSLNKNNDHRLLINLHLLEEIYRYNTQKIEIAYYYGKYYLLIQEKELARKKFQYVFDKGNGLFYVELAKGKLNAISISDKIYLK